MLLCSLASHGAAIRGKVVDTNQEALVGAHVFIAGRTDVYGVAGLDGSYTIANLATGTYSLSVSYVGYKNFTQDVTIAGDGDVVMLQVVLEPDQTELTEILITANAERGSDAEARSIERTSPNTVNIISAKAISLSPDISVANVIQRVSGLSVQRNSNGDPQYAIVRGMDKRYSYTLVNGLKIPSPDNKNRYVPLDIFPAALLERLEVYKSLTADQEGDAIGGGINMVMKSAPESLEIKGDLQLGYNYINTLHGFDKYTSGVVAKQSPRETYGPAYLAQPADFTQRNLETKNVNPLPDLLASLSVGNRFLHDRLGVMLGGSFQNSYRGTKSLWFDYDTDRYGANLPSLRSVQDRHYSTQQLRGALHTQLDFRIHDKHELKLYSGYYTLVGHEAREIRETYLDGRNYNDEGGNAILSYSTRTKNTNQSIQTTSLQGKHRLLSPLTLTWSGVYSTANNDEPDNARFIRTGVLSNFVEQPQEVDQNNSRQWMNNKDTDLTGYVNFTLQPERWGASLLKAGGMARHKDRNAFYNAYRFDPINPSRPVQGVNWQTYSDVNWEVVSPSGSAINELNYTAHENIQAAYLLGKITIQNLDLNAGVRLEHTDQGYTLKYPKTGQAPDSSQSYTDVLPSLSARYKLSPTANLHFTYYKAISRPGFFEIVPYQLPDDGYREFGNPSLNRAKADNFDLRWEKFHNATDQILLGVFFKRIEDPIEYIVTPKGITNEPVQQPNNFGTARNMGIEADVTHYFSRFGIRANYTYTYSRITTAKIIRTRADINDPSTELVLKTVEQTRSLQGQAKHIGNLSLLYKDLTNGWESQLSLVYTGERLEVISPYLDNDIYAKPIAILDFSLEKKVSRTIDVFLKANNLLNSAYLMYVKKPIYQGEGKTVHYPFQDDPENKTLVRKDQYYQSFRIGVRMQWLQN